MKRKFLFLLFISMLVLHCGSFGKESSAEIKAYIEEIDKIVSAKKSQSFKRNGHKIPKGKEYVSSYYADKVITEYHGNYHLILDGADEHLMFYYEVNEKGKPHGVYKLYDENEKLIETGFLEKEGIRSGTVKTFYPTGELKSKLPYFHGKIVGSFKKYYKSGKVQEISEQNIRGIHGRSKIFYENGRVKEEFTYVNGKEEGIGTTYYENGKIESKQSYKHGKKHGETICYYPDEKIKSKYYFKDGREEGKFIDYYENGKIKGYYIFKNGKYNGEAKVFYKSGKVNISQTWKNGKREGKYFEYFEDGRIKEQLFFKKGELIENK